MAFKINGTEAINNSRKGLLSSLNIGTYTPATRPSPASSGDIIYNSTLQAIEVWDGSKWVNLSGSGGSYAATGGTFFSTPTSYVHVFYSTDNFVVKSPIPAGVSYLVIGGGGGGGPTTGGGGGAGGYRTGSGFPVSTGSYTITVGAGGAGNSSGSSSIFSTITSAGGGRGGPGSSAGSPGGSGGGGGGNSYGSASGGSGNTPPVSPSQGNSGGGGFALSGGGGGGAGLATGPGIGHPLHKLLLPEIVLRFQLGLVDQVLYLV
jgi:hypothetical protein